MSHQCAICGWQPADDATYPEDRVIDHINDKHIDGEVQNNNLEVPIYR